MIVATGCGKPAEAAKGPRRDPPVPVRLAPVIGTNWDSSVAIVGTLFAKDEAALSAEVEGGIERTTVEFGDRVTNNQELAYIDTSLYQALVDQAAANQAKAQATLTNASNNLARIKTLSTSGIASPSDLDQAVSLEAQGLAEFKSIEATVAVARLNLERSKVRAPFDGAIAQRIVGRGDFAKVGTPLFQVVNDDLLKFIFQVPEKHASRVEKGLPVTFTVDNYPGETFTGKVYLISPQVNTGSRNFSVGALVTNTTQRLKANTFARGALVLEKNRPALAVPLDAVVNFAGVTKVFVVTNNKAAERQVRTGRVMGPVQEILDGLKAGELVAVTGTTKLHDGGEVTVQTANPPAPDRAKP